MKKRFTLRKVKQYSYSRQGYILRDLGYVFAIYDCEWRKNLEMKYGFTASRNFEAAFKYIGTANSKEVAQYWADWLNDNCSNEFGIKLQIPLKVFNEGLALYH